MNEIVYKMIIDELECELTEINDALVREEERKRELMERRFEILVGIDGIKQMMLKGRI